MSMTQAELNELLGAYSAENTEKERRNRKQSKQSSLAQATSGDAFESAAKKIIGDDAVDFLSGTFGRGGTLDIGSALPVDTVRRGLMSGVAGLATMPYELPALAEAGIEAGAGALGYDVDVPLDLTPGRAYGAAAEFLDAELPEDATEAEKALYYGLEALPMFGGGGLIRGAMRAGQGALSGRLAEENAVAGVALGMAPIPGATRTGVKQTRVDALDDTSAQLGQDLASQYGITETRGQSLYRAAQQETNPELRIKKLAEAESVLAAEEAGRRASQDGLAPGVRSNVRLWKEADTERAQQIEDAMRKIVGVPKGRKKPVDVKKSLVSAYQGWSKRRMEAFRKANADDFAKLDKGIKFNLENVVDKIDELVDEYALGSRVQENPQNTLLKIRRKIIDEQGNMKDLSAVEIQAIMQDLGQLAWKGFIPGLDDINPGIAKAVSRRMISVFDEALDNISANSDELTAAQANALKEARQNYKARITALKDESSGALMSFFALDPASSTPNDIVNKLESVSDDPDQVKIFSSLIQEEFPELWTETKQVLFNREIAKLTDEAGFISVPKLRQAKERLLENEMLFGDSSSSQGLQRLEKLFDDLEGVFYGMDASEIADLSQGNLYQTLKLGSEVGGSIGGPKPRYVGEAITKIAMMVKGNKIPAEAAAYIANNPEVTTVLTKALRGKANALTPKEMARLRTLVTLGRIQTFTAIPPIYFARDENDSAERTAEFMSGLFSEEEGE